MPELSEAVMGIIQRVRDAGDQALLEMTELFDSTVLKSIRVSEQEIAAAKEKLNAEQLNALKAAARNLRRFHEAQLPAPLTVNITGGVSCERVWRPIDVIGLYVPAGTAPLPSTALMLGVPAAVAGCDTKVLCTPPRADGTADPSVLVAAELCGVTEIFKVGGAQAVAAMAYGTASVPKVAKIFGPGNNWVTLAKQQVSIDPDGAALDMPAGPSEVLVIADAEADPKFVAADLLSQAEHGTDSQVMLVATSEAFAEAVNTELRRQLKSLPRAETAAAALENGCTLLVSDVARAVEISNRYAPEHLILQVRGAREYLAAVKNAGSVFLGSWTPEAIGDYCSGTNHVLPTNGYARALSGLSVEAFMKQVFVQESSPEGLSEIGPIAETLARLEGLDAHARAVSLRLQVEEGATHERRA